jgi:hypothetical protein
VELWVSVPIGVIAGQAAKEIINRLVNHFSSQADNVDIDAAASAWGKLSMKWINTEQVQSKVAEFWSAR